MYLGICLLGALPLAAAPVALVAAWRHQASRPPQDTGTLASRWSLLMVGGVTALYLLHVWRAGGGFMYARLFVPAVPGLLFLLAAGAAAVSELRLRRLLVGSAVLVPLLTPTPPQLLERTAEGVGWAGIVHERSWYPEVVLEEARRQAEILRPLLHDTGVVVAIFGSQAMLAYLADIPIAVESDVGLTDPDIARLPAPPGARPGHGPKASADYLADRGVDLMLRFRWPQADLDPGATVVFADKVTGRVLARRPEIQNTLRARGVTGPGLGPR
jgi:hypothetical protein